MKAIKLSLIAGALLAAGTSAAAAQPAGPEGRRAPVDVTRDQALARADQMFARLDANRDGRVTADEARQHRQARMGERQARQGERRGQMFDRLDVNRDGSLSREEFAQARAQRGDGQPGHRMGRRGGRGGMGARGPQAAARMFGTDGVITREEFRARALQRFERLDANRDGTITVAERRESRQNRRQQRQERRAAPQQN